MNWMANSKNRIQKRKSASTNLQKSFFAGCNKIRSSSSIHPDRRPLYSDPRPPATKTDKPKLLDSKLPKRDQGFDINGCERDTLWPSCSQDYYSETAFPHTSKAESSANEFSKKLALYPERRTNLIRNEECKCNSRSKNHLEQEVLRLERIISEQKFEIKRLAERLLYYEREPCADRLIKGADSGGPRSFLAAAEGIVASDVIRDEISGIYKRIPWISNNDKTQVTINICAGAIAYNNYNSNSQANLMGNRSVRQSLCEYEPVNHACMSIQPLKVGAGQHAVSSRNCKAAFPEFKRNGDVAESTASHSNSPYRVIRPIKGQRKNWKKD